MNKVYITVYKPIAGWKAVLMHDEDGPMETGYFTYKTMKEAEQDAKAWAEAEEIEYIEFPNRESEVVR